MLDDDEELAFYYTYKAVRTLILSSDFDYVFNIVSYEFVLDSTFLVYIYDFIPLYEHIMDKDMKNNIYKLMNYYRNEYQSKDIKEQEKINEMVNNIIEFTNKSDDTDTLNLVSQEFRARGFSYIDTFMWNVSHTLDDIKRDIKIFNTEDFRILTALLDVYSDEDFKVSVEEIANLNSTYMYNICLMVKECPRLLEDEIVVKRIKMINDILKENIKSAKDTEYISVRRAKKEYKQYIKSIKGI